MAILITVPCWVKSTYGQIIGRLTLVQGNMVIVNAVGGFYALHLLNLDGVALFITDPLSTGSTTLTKDEEERKRR